MAIHTRHSQISDALQAVTVASVPYCFIGGVAANLYSVRAGRGGRIWNDVDVLIDVSSRNILTLHKLLTEDLLMYPLGCPGIHAFQDPTYRKGSDSEYCAMSYSQAEDFSTNSIKFCLRFDPFNHMDVIKRALEHKTERGEIIRVATIDDLLANKRIAAKSRDRTEHKRHGDDLAIQFFEELLAETARLN